MNLADMEQAEQLFECRLPEEYKFIMITTSDGKYQLPKSLLKDINSVIGINREMREGEFKDEWRSQWFVIGDDACGDLFFLDLSAEISSVYLWDHETHETSMAAKTLSGFIDAELINPSK